MHSCPVCGQACCCGGDIDDCLNEVEDDVLNCTCCFSGAIPDDDDDCDYEEDSE